MSGFNEIDLHRWVTWEQSLANDSPEGRLRVLWIEAGQLGMKIRVVDKSQNPDGSDNTRTVFQTGFFVADNDEYLYGACLHSKEDDTRVKLLLRSLGRQPELVMASTDAVEELLMLCFIKPHALSVGGWMREYAPHFMAFHEARILARREKIVSEVLNA